MSEEKESFIPPFDDQYLIKVLTSAKEFYEQNNIEYKYIGSALNLIRTYYLTNSEPREPFPFFVAVLYIVSRHPWTYPNPFTKIEFISRFNIHESAFDWYTRSICESLNVITLHDSQHYPYFIPPDDLSYCILFNRIKHASSINRIWNAVSVSNVKSISILADEIVDELVNKVNIIPAALQGDLYQFIERAINKESNKKLIDL